MARPFTRPWLLTRFSDLPGSRLRLYAAGCRSLVEEDFHAGGTPKKDAGKSDSTSSSR